MKIKILLVFNLILIFVFSINMFAQESSRLVKKVEVVDNEVISKVSSLAKLQTKEETEYSPVTLSDDIKRLYATGMFSDVSVDIVELDEGVKVIFRVQEKPVLNEIIFSGNLRIKTKKLLREMKVKTDEILDKFKLKEDLENLKALYEKKG